MATIPIPRYYPPPYADEDKVRNGKRPDWRVPHHVVYRTNFTLAKMRKLVFCKSLRPDNLPQYGTGQTTTWRWQCRTGESYENGNTLALRAVATVVPPHGSSGVSTARWRFSAGASNSSWHTVPGSISTPTFNDVKTQVARIIGLTPNTEYQCSVTVEDSVRLASLLVYEETSKYINTLASYASIPSQGYGLDKPITDLQHGELSTDGYNIWKHNGAHVFNLTPDEPDAAPWTTASASYVNMLNSGHSTTVSAHTAGVNAAVQYHNPTHTDDVNAVFAVFGKSQAAGGTDDVILKDSSGVLATLSDFNSSGEWKSVAFALDGSITTHKVDVQFRDTDTDTLTVYAASVYEYEA